MLNELESFYNTSHIRLEPFNERGIIIASVLSVIFSEIYEDKVTCLAIGQQTRLPSFCMFHFMTDSRDYGLADTSRARLSLPDCFESPLQGK